MAEKMTGLMLTDRQLRHVTLLLQAGIKKHKGDKKADVYVSVLGKIKSGMTDETTAYFKEHKIKL